MKKLTLLEVTLNELNNQEPAVGTELAIQGIRYRVLQVKTRSLRASKWRRRKPAESQEHWQVLVETMEETK